jgi:hypothetical protein
LKVIEKATIEIKQKTMDDLSFSKVEKFVNSKEFEDLVLNYKVTSEILEIYDLGSTLISIDDRKKFYSEIRAEYKEK